MEMLEVYTLLGRSETIIINVAYGVEARHMDAVKHVYHSPANKIL
jgi:hypothetical protein